MKWHPIHQVHRQSDTLHWRIYEAVAALALWLVLSAWAFFSTGAYASLALAVVSGFVLIAVGLPFILSHAGPGLDHAARPVALRDWIKGDFRVWGGQLGGAEAATQVLLPIAAVSIGMTLIGLAFYFAR